MTIADLMRSNDLSQAQAEKALANLQAKGLVTGFVPGDLTAEITVTSQADVYLSVPKSN